jgi:hypothetical protein
VPGHDEPGGRARGRFVMRNDELRDVKVRLADAAERGEQLEVILVLRGLVQALAGGTRWRMRTDARRIVTFGADAVIAVTPISRHATSRA